MEVSVITANILTFLIGATHFYKILQRYTNSYTNSIHANFTYDHEKAISHGRSRLRALVVLLFSHDMQIQEAHALCKQGCRLISNTANKRIVTIETCYNCPRSPLCKKLKFVLAKSPTRALLHEFTSRVSGSYIRGFGATELLRLIKMDGFSLCISLFGAANQQRRLWYGKPDWCKGTNIFIRWFAVNYMDNLYSLLCKR